MPSMKAIALCALALVTLPGCAGYTFDSPSGSSGAGFPMVAAPYIPPAPPSEYYSQEQPTGGGSQVETHGVTKPQQCYDMAQRFARQGRRVRLQRVVSNKNPGATLRFLCIFEGEDAQEGWFEDTRY